MAALSTSYMDKPFCANNTLSVIDDLQKHSSVWEIEIELISSSENIYLSG